MKLRVRETAVRVAGFRFAGVACGIKGGGKLDLALVVSERAATVAAAFTRNRVKAAPVVIAARHARRGRARAVLINSGNANACTGAAGARTAIAGCRAAGAALGVSPYDVVPCSTGKIGVALPQTALVAGARAAAGALSPDGLWRAARAMMTTDAFPKVAVRRIRLARHAVTIAGLAKGAGMIAPDVATLLVCVVTDAVVPASVLRRALRDAVAPSFNAITVDGDTSTNDSIVVLANGAAANAAPRSGTADARRFTRALTAVMAELSEMVVADGEGATKRVHVRVTGARSDADARRIARAVGESQLVKTAFFGADPNWGRIVCAAGYAGVPLRPERMSVRIEPASGRAAARPARAADRAAIVVLRSGTPADARTVARAAAVMRHATFGVTLDAGTGGRGRATIVTSDLSPAYVTFNSAYST